MCALLFRAYSQLHYLDHLFFRQLICPMHACMSWYRLIYLVKIQSDENGNELENPLWLIRQPDMQLSKDYMPNHISCMIHCNNDYPLTLHVHTVHRKSNLQAIFVERRAHVRLCIRFFFRYGQLQLSRIELFKPIPNRHPTIQFEGNHKSQRKDSLNRETHRPKYQEFIPRESDSFIIYVDVK